MKHNKKGIIFEVLIFFVVLITLTSAYYAISTKNDIFDNKPIGKRQFDIIRMYQESEKALSYVDQSAHFTAQQAIYDIAKEGGSSNAECGDYLGYQIWSVNQYPSPRECYPTLSSRENLQEVLRYRIGDVLKTYPNANLPEGIEYGISINELGEITGTTNTKFIITLDESGLETTAISEGTVPAGSIASAAAVFDPYIGTGPFNKEIVPITGVHCSSGSGCRLGKDAFVQLQEAERLANAQGYKLFVFSGYRSLEQQIGIWNRNAEKYPDPVIRRKWVCNPYPEETAPNRCPHIQAGAVDIFFWQKPDGSTYTSKSQMTPADKQKLAEFMSAAKFAPYPTEWWHWEYGTVRWRDAQNAIT